jgi:putative transposase
MLRQTPLATGEVYHVFNRGAHKQGIFLDDADFQRFQLNLHVANHAEPVLIREILDTKKYREPFSAFLADKTLVDVLAYTLLPNHFHLVLRQKVDGGITKFMRKVGVGYSMYFNLRHEHSGVLFQGRFKSSHIDSEPYFRWIFTYLHLNHLVLKCPDWESQGIENIDDVKKFMNSYRFSSFIDYSGNSRPEGVILSRADVPDFLRSQNDLEDLLKEYTENRSLYI